MWIFISMPTASRVCMEKITKNMKKCSYLYGPADRPITIGVSYVPIIWVAHQTLLLLGSIWGVSLWWEMYQTTSDTDWPTISWLVGWHDLNHSLCFYQEHVTFYNQESLIKSMAINMYAGHKVRYPHLILLNMLNDIYLIIILKNLYF